MVVGVPKHYYFEPDCFRLKEMESLRKLLPEVSGFAVGYVNLRPNR